MNLHNSLFSGLGNGKAGIHGWRTEFFCYLPSKTDRLLHHAVKVKLFRTWIWNQKHNLFICHQCPFWTLLEVRVGGLPYLVKQSRNIGWNPSASTLCFEGSPKPHTVSCFRGEGGFGSCSGREGGYYFPPLSFLCKATSTQNSCLWALADPSE